MSENPTTPPPTGSTETIRLYHPAPEIGQPHRPPENAAREHFAAIFGAKSHRLTQGTIRLVDSKPVIVNADGTDFRDPKPGEVPHGQVMTYSAEGHPVVNDAGLTPVVSIIERTDDYVIANSTETALIFGGSLRVLHNLDTEEVDVTAKKADGEGIGVMFSVIMSPNEVQVEVMPETHTVIVTKTKNG